MVISLTTVKTFDLDSIVPCDPFNIMQENNQLSGEEGVSAGQFILFPVCQREWMWCQFGCSELDASSSFLLFFSHVKGQLYSTLMSQQCCHSFKRTDEKVMASVTWRVSLDRKTTFFVLCDFCLFVDLCLLVSSWFCGVMWARSGSSRVTHLLTIVLLFIWLEREVLVCGLSERLTYASKFLLLYINLCSCEVN